MLWACLFARKKIDHQNGAVPDKSKGKRGKRCRKPGERVRGLWV